MAALGPRNDDILGLPLAGIRVLVAEDDVINQEIVGGYLAMQGAAATIAGDGNQAFARLSEQPRGYDIVLMDVHMPVMDGFETTRRIRGELGLLDLPIVALTAGILPSERDACTRSGMDGFLPKPIAPAAMLAVIQRLAAPRGRASRS